ncbi:MAG: diguanylate phosphodiesterase, partial [Candidatus Tectomicrobia bacterium]
LNDKPHELLITALVRAKMCEGLARALGRDDTDSFFLVGLFSVLDALLDQPMREVLQALPLAVDLMQALLHGQGVLGSILHSVVAYEQGNWEEITWPDVDHRAVMDAYLVAIAWATDVSNTLV